MKNHQPRSGTDSDNRRWLRRLVRCHGLSPIVLVFYVVVHLMFSNHAFKRVRAVKDSRLVEEIRHGLHLFLRCFKARLQLIKPLLVGCALCGLMLCDCVANPMAATSNQQTEQRQPAAPQTTTTGQAEDDAAKSDSNAAPRRDALESLKVWFCHRRVQLAIMALSGFGIGYTIGKWRMEKIMARMTPNVES